MPASDLSAVAVQRNFSSAYILNRYRADGFTESNVFKLCRAMSVGFHAETGQAVDDLEPQLFAYTAEGGFLDHHGFFWNRPRAVGEVDEALRVRIGQVKLVKWGAFNVDEMLTLLANLLTTDETNIGFTENVDGSGNWEPGLITFQIAPSVFVDNGIMDVPTAIASLLEDMEKVAPAGVRVIITSTGSGIWDSGDDWDSGQTFS